MNDAEPTLDAERLDRIVDGDADFLRDLAGMFAQDVGARVNELSTALDTSELDAARRIAHAIRGACANLGATRMAKLSQALEHCDGLLQARELARPLGEELASVNAALAARLRR